MIQVRELETDDRGRTSRACSGCGKNAAVQIVGQTIVGDRPSSESVDLCKACGGRVANALVGLRRRKVLASAKR